MRCSAWSSPVIWASSGVAAATLALAVPPVAAAHLSLNPSVVKPGALVDLTFSAPNQDDPVGIDHVTIGIPAGFALDDPEAEPGWAVSRGSQAITWSGGLIPRGDYATFSIRGTVPAKPGQVLFDVLVGDRTGRSITYRVALDVSGSVNHDAGARSLGLAALVVAVLAAVLAAGAGFLALEARRHRPRPPAS